MTLPKQLLDDLTEGREFWKQKEEALTAFCTELA
jgi:hypothetical protein